MHGSPDTTELPTAAATRKRPRSSLQAFLSSSDAALQMAAVETLEPIYVETEELPRLVETQRIRLAREK